MYTSIAFSVTVIAFIFLIKSQGKGRRTVFEPGVIIIGLFSFCYLVPAIAIIYGVNVFRSVNPMVIESISLYGLVFVGFFLFFYRAMRVVSRLRIFPARSLNIDWSPRTCFIGFILIFGIKKIILSHYGVGDSDDYSQQYIERASLPLLIRQGLNLLNPIQWMFIYMILVSSFGCSNRKRSMGFVWIAFSIMILDMWFTNSRSQIVTLSFAFIATYTLYRRPIGLKKEITLAALFIIILSVFSLKRVVSDGDIDFLSVLIPGEFLIIYHNAMNLVSWTESSYIVSPPGNSYLQSFIAFIPSQINEHKWDLSTWYVEEYFPDTATAGGGLAFGIIPEAIVNWGFYSIVFQAFIVAAIFRFSYFSAYRARFSKIDIRVLFYLFCFSQIYQLIRSHSFSIFVGLVVGFIVPFMIIFLFSQIRLTLNR